MSEKNQATITLTAEQLESMFVRMAQEIRRPADPTPEQLAQKENDRRDREANARGVLEEMEGRRRLQMACSHERINGGSTCVYVYGQQNNPAHGGYVICQQCQAIIHPGERPTGPNAADSASHFYDTALFNRHYQKAMAQATNF